MAALLLLAAVDARAVPSFARQMGGMACSGCHTVFPELNAFGRQFKLRGFALGNGLDDKKFPLNLPLSAVATVSRTSIKNSTGVDPGAIPRDRDVVLPTAGVYYGGKITTNLGALVQYNYDGIKHRTALEMADVRYAKTTDLVMDKELVFGVTLNNNPTLSDIYNSTPMWSFPHLMSDVALMPNATTLVDNRLFAQVGGVGAYGYWNNLVYAEFALYRRADKGVFRPLSSGVDVDNVVNGYAPYWRLALQRDSGAHSWMVGTYGLVAKIFPDPTMRSGATNRFRDLAIDGQYQYITDRHLVSAHATWIREKQTWDASFPLGMTDNPTSKLNTVRADVHYYFQRRYGGGIQYFSTYGDVNGVRYNTGDPVMGSANGSPNSKGWILDLNVLPLQNIKVGARYTYYTEFNGAKSDYDGLGRSAKDNNTLFLYGWFLF